MAAKVHIPAFKTLGAFPVTYLPNGWGVAVIDVTPEVATEMLQRNAGNQRDRKEPTINRYAEDMRLGQWRLTHQGIAFNAKGHLHDGQHRLSAVIVADVSVPLLVFFGAGADQEMAVIDTNKVRTLTDSATVLSLGFKAPDCSLFNAAVRYGAKNGNGTLLGMTNTTRLELMNRNADLFASVLKWFGTSKFARKVSPAPVRAAVTCAAFHVDHDRLARFVAVFTDQVDDAKPTEDAAKSLRQLVVSSERVSQSNELFLKSCRAIQHFLNGTTVGRYLYAAPGNPFPLPEPVFLVEAI